MRFERRNKLLHNLSKCFAACRPTVYKAYENMYMKFNAIELEGMI